MSHSLTHSLTHSPLLAAHEAEVHNGELKHEDLCVRRRDGGRERGRLQCEHWYCNTYTERALLVLRRDPCNASIGIAMPIPNEDCYNCVETVAMRAMVSQCLHRTRGTMAFPITAASRKHCDNPRSTKSTTQTHAAERGSIAFPITAARRTRLRRAHAAQKSPRAAAASVERLPQPPSKRVGAETPVRPAATPTLRAHTTTTGANTAVG